MSGAAEDEGLVEAPEASEQLRRFVEMLEAPEYAYLLIGESEVDQGTLERVAARSQFLQHDHVAGAPERRRGRSFREFLFPRRALRRATREVARESRTTAALAQELADVGRQLQAVLFDCPLDAPPSPVLYRWRPPPKGLMVLACEHGPPEHCWQQAAGGSFKPGPCP